MAAQINTWTGAVNTLWNNAGNWDTAVEADRVPDTGDLVVFDASSAVNCDVGVATAALGSLTMTGYTGTLTIISTTTDIDVNGDAILNGTIALGLASGDIYCSGSFTKTAGMTALPSGLNVILDGTGNVTTNSVLAGAVDVNTTGTVTSVESGANTAEWKSFARTTGGTYVDGGEAHNIAGSILISAGTLTSTGTWTMTASGNIVAATAARLIYNLIIGDGVTATMTGDTRFNSATVNATATLNGGYEFFAHTPSANNFLNMAGTIGSTVNVSIYLTANRSNTGTIKAATFSLPNSGGITLTQTGVLTVATASIIVTGSNNNFAKLVLGVTGCSLGAVTLGSSTVTNRTGRLDLGDGAYAVSMTSLASAGLGTSQLDFGDAVVTLTGTLNGTLITCNSDAAAGTHALISGGTISNVSIAVASPALDCTAGVINGGVNSNCWFTGTKGVHSLLGGGFIGSARAA